MIDWLGCLFVCRFTLLAMTDDTIGADESLYSRLRDYGRVKVG